MITVYKKFFLMLGVTVLLCLSASVVWSETMDDLKELLYKMSQSDQIKSYFNKMKGSLVLIGKCFVLLVFLVGMVFLSDYLITSIIQ